MHKLADIRKTANREIDICVTIKTYMHQGILFRKHVQINTHLTTCTVVILINATTLMHKSTLSTDNFGKNHFGQKYQKQNIPRNFRL